MTTTNEAATANDGTTLPPAAECLYFFDEPLLFVIEEETGPPLCMKTDERDGNDVLLAVPTTPAILAALRDCRLSVRGALDRPNATTVTYDPDTRAVLSRVPFVDEPGERSVLSKPGLTLRPGMPDVPDRLAEDDADGAKT